MPRDSYHLVVSGVADVFNFFFLPPVPPPARSLGSVALRKAETVEGGVHFNVFTVDFNEELVALYGGSLLRQTHFLHESIKAILRLYKVRRPMSSTKVEAVLSID